MNSKNGIDWDKQPLGEKSDRQLAEELGTTVEAVKCARKRRKKPAYREPTPPPATKPKLSRRKKPMRGQAMCPECGRSDLRMREGRYAMHRTEAGGPKCDGSGAAPAIGMAVNGDVKLNHVW